MARLNRIGNTERLIIALRENDEDYLEELENFTSLYVALRGSEYPDGSETEDILKAIADLIEEAMERE